MAAYLIARIGFKQGRAKNPSIIGYRLLDVKTGKVLDANTKSLQAAIKSGSVKLENMEIRDGSLAGTNGSLDRYSIIEHPSMSVSGGGSGALVVLYQVEDYGYLVANTAGLIRDATKQAVISYSNSNGVSNGKVVPLDDKEILSAISGSYPVITLDQCNEYLKSKGIESNLYKLYGNQPKLDGRTPEVKPEPVTPAQQATQPVREADGIEAIPENFRTLLRNYYKTMAAVEGDSNSLGHSVLENLNITEEVETLAGQMTEQGVVESYKKNELLLKILFLGNNRLIEVLPEKEYNAITDMLVENRYPLPESAQDLVIAYAMRNKALILGILFPSSRRYLDGLRRGTEPINGKLQDAFNKVFQEKSADFTEIQAILLNDVIAKGKNRADALRQEKQANHKSHVTPETTGVSVTDTAETRTIVSSNPIEAMKISSDELDDIAKLEETIPEAPKKIELLSKPDTMSNTDWFNDLRGELGANQKPSISIQIADDMLKRNVKYTDMSPKQKYRFDDAIKELEGLRAKRLGLPVSDGTKAESLTGDRKAGQPIKDEDNLSYLLVEYPEIKANIDRIVSKANSVEMQAVLEQSPNVLKICYSILRYGKVSTRQLKHVKLAIEILDNQ